MSKVNRWLLAVYIIGFILTFGQYAATHRLPGYTETAICPEAIVISMWWPITWPLRLSWDAFDRLENRNG